MLNILVVEDDVEVGRYVKRGLDEIGHVVSLAETGHDALLMLAEREFDVIILDRMLPDIDGMSVLRQHRNAGGETPTLILSALGDLEHRVEGIKSGGDDYLCKPFAISELDARIDALTRRSRRNEPATHLRIADLEIDLMARTATRSGRPIVLQNREFKLLEYLVRNAGRVVTRTMMLEKVWDYHFDPQTNVIDVHISRLRQKIDRGFDAPLIQTVRGVGYMLCAPDGDAS